MKIAVLRNDRASLTSFRPLLTSNVVPVSMKNTMINSNEFYAGLTPLYHLVYPDWGKSLKRQGDILDSVIHEMWGAASEVLDVSCGIGTQTLGLAGLGYVVTASDLSFEEVNRAKQEVQQRLNARREALEAAAMEARLAADAVDVLGGAQSDYKHGEGRLRGRTVRLPDGKAPCHAQVGQQNCAT